MTHSRDPAIRVAQYMSRKSRQGDPDKALAAGEDFLARHGDVSHVLCVMGIIYFRQGQFQKAEEFFNRALIDYPKSIVAFTGLGQIRMEQGRFEEALCYFAHVLEISPDDKIAKSFRFNTLAMQEKKREEENPVDSGNIAKLLVTIQEELGKKSWGDEALQVLIEAVKKEAPDNNALFLLRIKRHLKRNEFSKTQGLIIQRLEKMVDIDAIKVLKSMVESGIGGLKMADHYDRWMSQALQYNAFSEHDGENKRIACLLARGQTVAEIPQETPQVVFDILDPMIDQTILSFLRKVRCSPGAHNRTESVSR